MTIRNLSVLVVSCAALIHCSPLELALPEAPAATTTEWIDYGGDLGGQRHVDLAGVTPENVDRLAHAWTYRHGDVSDGTPPVVSPTAFENTPILVDGTLYFCTPCNRVIALDPATG